MKNQIDQIHCRQGFGDGFGIWESRCRLRVFEGHPEGAVVIVLDLGEDNNGTTITNCAAQLANNTVKKFNLDPRSLTWIEHLPDSETEYGQVEFDWNGLQASLPRWAFLHPEQMEALVAQSSERLPPSGITTSYWSEKFKDPNERLWYIQKTIDHGWSHHVMHPQYLIGSRMSRPIVARSKRTFFTVAQARGL